MTTLSSTVTNGSEDPSGVEASTSENHHLHVGILHDTHVNVATTSPIHEELIEVSDAMFTDDGREIVVIDGHEYVRHDLVSDGVDEDDNFEYDPVSLEASRGFAQMYELYQPINVLENGTFMCRICLQAGQAVQFRSRQQFQHHRYKAHGTFAHNLPCPISTCRDAFASLPYLKRHLHDDHALPLETHHRIFPDMQRFEQWRILIEGATGSKFVLHNKQRETRRQVMHCIRSEHKTGSSIRKPRLKDGERGTSRMSKEGACCPAHISFSINKDGSVDVLYQMIHVGHGSMDNRMDEGRARVGDSSADFRLPSRPALLGERPMQYIQIDIVEMSISLYGMSRYTHILLLTDLRTKFVWARPLQDHFDRNLLVRHFVDIFTQFGIPEGYSSSLNFELVRLAMRVVAYIFKANIVEIGNQTPDYMSFRRGLYDMAANEVNNRDRWAEMVPFACLNHNHVSRNGEPSSFELFFGRPAFPGDDDSTSPQWLSAVNSTPTITFEVGDRVFMRNFDCSLRDSKRDELTPDNMVLAVIGDVDWSRPSFPYHVYYSRERNTTWPDRNCDSMFVSAFDLAPSTVDLMIARDEERRVLLQTMLCTCQQNGRPCTLIRTEFCSNAMSQACCLRSETPCDFHREYINGAGDTYYKLQQLYRKYRDAASASTSTADADSLKKSCKAINKKLVERSAAGSEVAPVSLDSKTRESTAITDVYVDVAGMSDSKEFSNMQLIICKEEALQRGREDTRSPTPVQEQRVGPAILGRSKRIFMETPLLDSQGESSLVQDNQNQIHQRSKSGRSIKRRRMYGEYEE